MKCYFCNTELRQPQGFSNDKYPLISETCPYCTPTYGMFNVSSVVDKEGKYVYAHIYPDEQQYLRTGFKAGISLGTVIRTNVTYHVRLDIQDQKTHILVCGTTEDVLVLPTLNITPANVRTKLKTYLLFS